MVDQKCKQCGRMIFAANQNLCKHCQMKETIESGGMKKGKGKKHANWDNFHT